MSFPFPRAIVAASIPLAFAAAWVAAPLEWTLYDARLTLRSDGGWPADLVCVRLDEADLEALGGWPLPARSIARLLDAVHVAGAETIVLDAFLGTAGGPEEEARLAPLLARTVTAVTFDPVNGRAPSADELRAALVPAAAEGAPSVAAPSISFPAESIAASVARLGHAGLRAGTGPVRASPPLVRVDGFDGALPSQALAALIAHRGIDPAGIRATRTSLTLPGRSAIALVDGETLLDFAGDPPREIAAADLLAGRIAARSLAGTLAVVHVDTPEDRHSSPLSPETPGGWLLASAIRTLDGGRAPLLFPLWASLAICVSLAFAALSFARRQARLTACAALEAAWLAGALLLVPVADVFLPVLAPMVVFCAAVVAAILSATANASGGRDAPS